MNNLIFFVVLLILIAVTPLVLLGIYRVSKKNESITKSTEKDINVLGQRFDKEIDSLKQDIEEFEI